jgi:gliding motility-associated lipoprotein GldH
MIGAKQTLIRRVIPAIMFLSGIYSCQTIDLYEKNVSIPDFAWKSNFKPEFRFTIKDTTVPYSVYIVLRHNDRYSFNNIWVSLTTRVPGDTAVQKVQYELPLANSEGWIGAVAMDDLYEHRILITPRNEPVYFRKPGEYIFTIEQVMRQDPLENVMNVGLRIEKNSNAR